MKNIKNITLFSLISFSSTIFAGYQLDFKNDHASGAPLIVWGLPTRAPALMLAKIPYGATARLEWPKDLRTVAIFQADGPTQTAFEKYITEHPGEKTDKWIGDLTKTSFPWKNFYIPLAFFFNESNWSMGVPTGSVISLTQVIEKSPFIGGTQPNIERIGFNVVTRGIPSFKTAAEKELAAQSAEGKLWNGKGLMVGGKFITTQSEFDAWYKANKASYDALVADAKAKRADAEAAKRTYFAERKKLFGY